VTGDGMLTNAAALLLVGRHEPALDYIHRRTAGGDSDQRVRRESRSVIEQLVEVFTTAQANNPVRHLSSGLPIGQIRQLPERAVREAIVNGLAHRDWNSPAPTVVEHSSTTELGSLVGAHPTNVGNVLKSLADEGWLEPSRENRRGPGFYYRYAAARRDPFARLPAAPDDEGDAPF
jgi:ATP-dependent DNA helicase RecG